MVASYVTITALLGQLLGQYWDTRACCEGAQDMLPRLAHSFTCMAWTTSLRAGRALAPAQGGNRRRLCQNPTIRTFMLDGDKVNYHGMLTDS
ncbi:hypothetical protein EVG20_g6278 [Dentipellis fragilis]|uniref:Uncharacterized protein n=1 Tax=Dentipellis fragilis TaxID=205917 RepID=A0A4Y9YP37_9AGAM|nr:hypothetical protein EVG20_g6278 [Dentipellis fragilis]